MKSLLAWLACGVALLVPLRLSATIVRPVEKTFTVQPGGSLTATTMGGNITVKTAEIAEVRVTARQKIRTNDESEADTLLQKLELRMEQSGNAVTLEAKYPQQTGGWFSRGTPVTVDFIVLVPRQFNLELRTSGGDISTESLQGSVKARTSGGDLVFASIAGEIDAQTSGGDIKLQEGTAKTKLSTSGGDIYIERAGGPTEVSTSGGDIHIRAAVALVRATTSGGDIDAVIEEELRQEAQLVTSGGDVSVQVRPTLAFLLDAQTSGGDVAVRDVPLTIEAGGLGKSRLVGRVNGGSVRLKLRTSGGDIRVQPIPAATGR